MAGIFHSRPPASQTQKGAFQSSIYFGKKSDGLVYESLPMVN
jgi:hypothetical protein